MPSVGLPEHLRRHAGRELPRRHYDNEDWLDGKDAESWKDGGKEGQLGPERSREAAGRPANVRVSAVPNSGQREVRRDHSDHGGGASSEVIRTLK